MANPGNTGHGGYKMQRVTAIEPKENVVEVVLECGHTKQWYPYGGQTPEQYAKHLQTTTIKPFVVGKTRIKCESCRAK